MTNLKTLYDTDTNAWAKNQAEALRAAAKGNSNRPIDWENLAEEIEDLGKAERRSLQSHVRNVIEHLIKLQYSPADRPRRKWRRSVLNSRIEAAARLKESPSLRPHVAEIIADETEAAVKLAIAALDERGELPAALEQAGPVARFRPDYTPDQILGDWFPSPPNKDDSL